MTNSSLGELEITQLLRLSQELHNPLSGLQQRQHRLLEQAIHLTGSTKVVLEVGGIDLALKIRKPSNIVQLGWRDGEFQPMEQFLRDRLPPDPQEALMVDGALDNGGIFAACRRQLVPDEQWYSSKHVELVRKPADVDNCAQALRVLSPQYDYVGLMILHNWGDTRIFSPRELHILRLLLLALDWTSIIGHNEIEALRQSLPPRLARLLPLLLSADSEKEIAQKLGLTRHTIHEYVKMIYRHFGVRSRAEIIVKMLGKKSS